jgi:hypothetical protein
MVLLLSMLNSSLKLWIFPDAYSETIGHQKIQAELKTMQLIKSKT